MKQISFVITIIVLVVILFSMLKYASDEPIIENMAQGRLAVVTAIINDDSPTTSDLEKVRMLNRLNISDEKIKTVLDSNATNPEKIEQIKKTIKDVTF